MGWSSSIHAQTPDIDKVLECLRTLKQHECVVGRSGREWTGIYSHRCELTGGIETPNLASKLSGLLDAHVLGIVLCEEGFAFWLFLQGRCRDKHPVGKLRRLFLSTREVLNLAPDNQAKQTIKNALAKKNCARRRHAA